MARITETLTVPTSPADAFDLVADFTSTAAWDPGIRAARRLDDGPIGHGSRFEVQLALGGRSVPLVYEITGYARPHRVVLTTLGRVHRGEDEVSFRPTPDGTELTWAATFGLRGPGVVLDPVLAVGFRRAAADAVRGLADALGGQLDRV